MTDQAEETGRGSIGVIAILLLINAAGMTLLLSMSKLSQAAGLSPIAFGFWTSLSAGTALGLASARAGHVKPSRAIARYWGASALLSLALPQLIIFIAVGKIGSGLAAVGFALPTLTTWIIARLWGIEKHSAIRMAGALVGAMGAVWLLLPQGGALPDGALPWMLFACLASVILGAGNVYRGVAWPKGASGLHLASGMLLLSAFLFALMALGVGHSLAFWQYQGAILPVAMQMGAAIFLYIAYFALQKAAHPVIFGLIGQIGLVLNLIVGSLFLGESYSLSALGAVGLMVLGLLGIIFGGKAKEEDYANTPKPD